MTDMPVSYWLQHDDGLVSEEFMRLQATEGMRHLQRANWSTRATPALPDRLLASNYGGDDSYDVLWRDDRYACRAILQGSSINVQVAGLEREDVAGCLAGLREMYPATGTSDTVPITFWYQTGNGPRSHAREIAAPTWEEIQGNYAPDTRERMGSLMGFTPDAGGQLILMHGSPGTGKTYAIRALCRAWRGWCRAAYIVDVDEFFAKESGAYLMQVLLSAGEEADGPVTREAAGDPWTLLILEDAGELMTKDAKLRTGAALGRLLNITDGLVGQGLRVLTLITTNEEIRELNDAVARPGRCAAEVAFGKLPLEAARAWIESHGLDMPTPVNATLADLFGRLQRRPASPRRQLAGLRP